jgi:hypothetical protein
MPSTSSPRADEWQHLAWAHKRVTSTFYDPRKVACTAIPDVLYTIHKGAYAHGYGGCAVVGAGYFRPVTRATLCSL